MSKVVNSILATFYLVEAVTKGEMGLLLFSQSAHGEPVMNMSVTLAALAMNPVGTEYVLVKKSILDLPGIWHRPLSDGEIIKIQSDELQAAVVAEETPPI